MGLFSRKHNNVTINAPVSGTLIPLEDVDDEVFSKKMMGDGFAIEPSNGNIVVPVDGTIASVFPTRHALMIESKSGLQLMLHLGLDTVELNGKPFNLDVEEGQVVKAGDKLGMMDLDMINQAGKKTTVIVVVSNMDDIKGLSSIESKVVKINDPVQTTTI